MTACATLRSTVVLPFVFLWLSSRWKGQVGDTKSYVPDGSLCGLVWRSFCWGKVASSTITYVFHLVRHGLVMYQGAKSAVNKVLE